MVSLRQDSNGNYSARKRLPDDVREEYGRLYGARFEAKFSARASRGKQSAWLDMRQSSLSREVIYFSTCPSLIGASIAPSNAQQVSGRPS
jgi:hypothetical protein